MKVLIIGTKIENARLIRKMLKENDGESTVETAVSFEKGLSQIRTGETEVILVDIDLKENQRVENFDVLHSRFPHLPIVLLTSKDDSQLAALAFRMGAQDYIVKDQLNSLSLQHILSYAIQRKQSELALLQVNDEWEITFNSIPDLISILDCQHRIKKVNKAMAERLGLSPEECIGMPCYEVVHGFPHPPDFCPHVLTCQDAHEHVADVHEQKLGGYFSVTTTPVINKMGKTIGSIHVARDITERKESEEAIKKYASKLEKLRNDLEKKVQKRTLELRNLSHRLIQIQEEERRSLARELHDQTGQSLTVLNLQLSHILRSDGDSKKELHDAQQTVREILSEVRNLSATLHPGMLEDLGLLNTLEWYLHDYDKKTGIKIYFKQRGLETILPAEFNITVYRIIQETLTNITKHAGVKEAKVALALKNHNLSIIVEDKGTGFDMKSQSKGIGLRNIKERVSALNGTFNVHSAPGKGTRIEVQLKTIH